MAGVLGRLAPWNHFTALTARIRLNAHARAPEFEEAWISACMGGDLHDRGDRASPLEESITHGTRFEPLSARARPAAACEQREGLLIGPPAETDRMADASHVRGTAETARPVLCQCPTHDAHSSIPESFQAKRSGGPRRAYALPSATSW